MQKATKPFASKDSRGYMERHSPLDPIKPLARLKKIRNDRVGSIPTCGHPLILIPF